MVALEKERLPWVGELFRGECGPLREREQFSTRNTGDHKFIGFADVDQARRIGRAKPGVRLRDGDFWNGHVALVAQCDGGADGDVLEETLRHETGHANAAV